MNCLPSPIVPSLVLFRNESILVKNKLVVGFAAYVFCARGVQQPHKNSIFVRKLNVALD